MNWAYTSLGNAQKLFGLEDVVNSIELKLDDVYRAQEVARTCSRPLIESKLVASTWQEQNVQINFAHLRWNVS